jgi:ActR/RegA family two-component response regulator
MMRWLPVEAAQTAARFDPELHRRYHRLKFGRGSSLVGGMELLNVGQRVPHITCIIITGDANAEKATEAMRLGAFSFLEKPVEADRLYLAATPVGEKMPSQCRPLGVYSAGVPACKNWNVRIICYRRKVPICWKIGLGLRPVQ